MQREKNIMKHAAYYVLFLWRWPEFSFCLFTRLPGLGVNLIMGTDIYRYDFFIFDQEFKG